MNFTLFGGEHWKNTLRLCACHELTRTSLRLLQGAQKEVVWIDYFFPLYDERVESEVRQIVGLPCAVDIKYQYLIEQMKHYELYSGGCNVHNILPFVEGWCGIARATFGRFSDEHCVAQCDRCMCLLLLGDVPHAENAVDWNWRPASAQVRQFRDDVQSLCLLMGAQSVKPVAQKRSGGIQKMLKLLPLLSDGKSPKVVQERTTSLLSRSLLPDDEALLTISIVATALLSKLPELLAEMEQCAKKLRRLSKRTKRATSRDALHSLENEASVCSAQIKELNERHAQSCAAMKELWGVFLVHFKHHGSCELSVLFSVFFFLLVWDQHYPDFAVCGAQQLAPRFLSHTLFSLELCPLKIVSLRYAVDLCHRTASLSAGESCFCTTFQLCFPATATCTESCKEDLLQGTACWDKELDAKVHTFLATCADYMPLCADDV